MRSTKDILRTALRWTRDAIVIVNIAILMLVVINELSGWWLRLHEQDHAGMMKLRTEAHGGQPWVAEVATAQFNPETVWDEHLVWRFGEYHSRYYNVDKNGHRATVNPALSAGAKSMVDIFMLGGSTMFGYGGNRDEDTIASQLVDLLAGQGIVASIVNLGIPGHESTQELVHLLLELQVGRRPAICVFLDGFNEVIEPLRNSGRVGASWGADVRIKRGFANMIYPPISTALQDILGQTSLYGLLHKEPEYDFEIPPTLESDIARLYVTNVRAGEAIAARFGIDMLFFWQPMLATKQTLTPVEAKLNEVHWDPPMIKKHLDVFPKVSALVREQLADDKRFHDISKLFDVEKQTTYTDDCHYNRYANRAIAAAMMPALLPALQVKLQAATSDSGSRR